MLRRSGCCDPSSSYPCRDDQLSSFVRLDRGVPAFLRNVKPGEVHANKKFSVYLESFVHASRSCLMTAGFPKLVRAIDWPPRPLEMLQPHLPSGPELKPHVGCAAIYGTHGALQMRPHQHLSNFEAARVSETVIKMREYGL